jgi:hypothetical protein
VNHKKILLAGLPGTGKTTFIGALWYFVNSDHDYKTLKLHTLEEGEDFYLNDIASHWMQYKPAPRTNLLSKPGGNRVVMNLKELSSNEEIILDIPDFNGETFNQHFENRQWTNEFDRIASEMSGLLLFINPYDSNNVAKLLYRENEYQLLFGEQTSAASTATVTWNPKLSPNQVKLVEFLQFLQIHKKYDCLKVSIVISLWDKVNEVDHLFTPDKWLEQNLPLLHQYLISNPSKLDFKVFGISSQGGDYEIPHEVEKLIEKESIKRIIVNVDGEISNDISLPILWAKS